MTRVSRFEANLLRVLHALLGRSPVEGVLPLILSTRPRPDCLSPAAVGLVKDALAKGCVRRLVEAGGWRKARHLRGDRIAKGRLWERSAPESLGLTFSRESLHFLIWLTSDHPGGKSPDWRPEDADLTDGDRLLVYFAHEALESATVPVPLAGLPAVAGNGLVRLANPDLFAGGTADPPDFGPWVTGVGAAVVEAFQPVLAGRWVAVERAKGRITDAGRMRALGDEQEALLDNWLAACEAAGRRDLARFLLSAAATLLEEPRAPREWVGGLNMRALRMADRVPVHRSAGAFLRAVDRLRRWDRDARAVGYFDDGYVAGQLWKSDWEGMGGEAVAGRAREVLRGLDPLGLGGRVEN